MENSLDEKKSERLMRFMEEDVYKQLEEMGIISKLVDYHIEFRGKAKDRNCIDIYFDGLVLTTKFHKRKARFSIRTYDGLRELIVKKEPRFQSFFEGESLDNFDELVNLLPMVEGVFKGYPNRQRERKVESELARALRGNNDFVIIDIEIVARKSIGFWTRSDKKSNPEGDILALIRGKDGHHFLPIELKLSDANENVRNCASDEIKTFCNMVEGLFDEFVTNYQKVYEQKQRNGIIVCSQKKIEIKRWETEKPVGLILIIDDQLKDTHHLRHCKEHKDHNIYELRCSKDYFCKLEWIEELK